MILYICSMLVVVFQEIRERIEAAIGKNVLMSDVSQEISDSRRSSQFRWTVLRHSASFFVRSTIFSSTTASREYMCIMCTICVYA